MLVAVSSVTTVAWLSMGLIVSSLGRRNDLAGIHGPMTEHTIRLREEVAEQIRALKKIVEMAAGYGFDVRRPAYTAAEAVQWVYFAYLAAIKDQDGAAMSLGNVSSFPRHLPPV